MKVTVKVLLDEGGMGEGEFDMEGAVARRDWHTKASLKEVLAQSLTLAGKAQTLLNKLKEKQDTITI